MARPIKYNRNILHADLYLQADRKHVLFKTQKMIASDTGINHIWLNEIFKKFVEEGRLKVIGTRQRGQKSYLVTNPVEWCRDHHDLDGALKVETYLDSVSPPVQQKSVSSWTELLETGSPEEVKLNL